MIIWINGAYGVGKSTTAEALQKVLPNSFIFNPEMVGNCVRESKPGSLWRDDFQDYPSWRQMTYSLLKELNAMYSGTIIVPMTVLNPTYVSEIMDCLWEDGIMLTHFILQASPETIASRIIARKENETCWCYRQIPRCVAALRDDISGIRIDTDQKSVDAVAEEILTYLDDCIKQPFVFSGKYDNIVGSNGMTLNIIEKNPGDGVILPFYYYDIVVDGISVGKISIRIGSNVHSYWNGHVGYEIDEAYRGHHYSLDALKLVLPVAQHHGLDRIILTCDETNTASRRIIEASGVSLIEIAIPPQEYFAWRPNKGMQCVYELTL